MSKHSVHDKGAEGAKDQDLRAEDAAVAPSGAAKPEGPCAGEAEASTETDSLREKLASLEAELANLKDQYLRKAADFDNYRKRMVREKQDAIDFANQSLLLDLIPVIDDFERAIKASETTDDKASFVDGIRMIERRLVSELESKWGLKRFDSAGQEFDPNRHEALMVEKTDKVENPTVKEDFVKGYLLKERVVRAAKVSVLMPQKGGSSEQ